MEEKNEILGSANKNSKNLSIPQAIIIGCFIIAVALYAGLAGTPVKKDLAKENQKQPELIQVSAPKDTDHLRGSRNAVLTVVEYSDTECPFCKSFHKTMQKILSRYDGKVALVYRHFPLESLHAKARNEANATECAASLGGEEKFWEYLDMIFDKTTSNDGLDQNLLPVFAKNIGIDETAFKNCLAKQEFDAKIASTMAEGADAGVEGTPASFIFKDGKVVQVIRGAWPEEKLDPVIKKLLE